MAYADGLFIGKTDPYSKYKLLGDTTWVNAHTYVQKDNGLFTGEMGELYQVRWLLNKDYSSATEATSTASSGVTRYYTYVHGDNAFGTYDLDTDQPKLYILPNQVDSASPAGRVSYISWAGAYATKILNSKLGTAGSDGSRLERNISASHPFGGPIKILWIKDDKQTLKN